MATKVIKSEKVTLQDGTVVDVKPLNVKNLRKFMDVTKKFGGAKDEDEGLDLLVDAVQISLLAVDEEKFADREYLEDVLDMNSISDIMRIAGGVDINSDPNLPDATA